MYGQMNEDGEMTGGGVAYIYPGGATALCGSFVDGELIEARHAAVCSDGERPRFTVVANSERRHSQHVLLVAQWYCSSAVSVCHPSFSVSLKILRQDRIKPQTLFF